MAHQGGKEKDNNKRNEMFEWISKLEFEMLELPIPDIRIFLHMPVKYALKLKEERIEEGDQNENDINHLYQAEETYLQLVEKFNFDTIECVLNDKIRLKEDIHNEVYSYVKKKIKK